jgi:uncharacterized membrane protein
MKSKQLVERIFSVDAFAELHPLFVHFPVGLLFLTVIFTFLPASKKSDFQLASRYLHIIGSFFALLSCLSGYLLAQSQTYQEALVNPHQWLGIATFLVFLSAIFLPKWQKIAIGIGGILLLLTLYVGTILTHGSFQLWKEKIIQEVQKIVKKPILSQSEPSKVALPHSSRFANLEPTEVAKTYSEIPESSIKEWKEQGIIASSMDPNNHQMSINLVNVKKISPQILSLLSPYKDQIIAFRINDLPLNNAFIKELLEFKNVEILQLPHTQLTDESVKLLAQLPKLKQLNLYNNPITDQGAIALQKAISLQKLFVWQTQISTAALADLQKSLPKLQIEGGKQMLMKPDTVKR